MMMVVSVTVSVQFRGITLLCKFCALGLTVLLPHLLSLSPSWSRCRIRIFAPVTEQLSTEEVRFVQPHSYSI